jgi:hypothetical protein
LKFKLANLEIDPNLVKENKKHRINNPGYKREEVRGNTHRKTRSKCRHEWSIAMKGAMERGSRTFSQKKNNSQS